MKNWSKRIGYGVLGLLLLLACLLPVLECRTFYVAGLSP
jgi:hypothetical protein